MPLGTSQYVRHHQVTIARAAWGAASVHPHNLNDGNEGGPGGYTPNLVTIEKAWIVDVNGVYHAIETGIARVPAVDATNVSIVVGDNGAGAPLLASALTSILGAAPVSCVLEVSTRFAHSKEVGKLATTDETIAAAAPANLGLPISLLAAAGGTLQTIFVRTTGADTNDGLTVGTAILTWQEAADRIMTASPLHHSVLVDIGGGLFAGAMTLDGVQLLNGSNLYFVGAAPVAAGTDKTSLSAGAATLTAVRDWQGGDLLRFTGDAAWGGAGVPAAGDIGRTVRIDDGAGGHTMYATVANVGTGGALATQYVDLMSNPALLAAPPAWLAAAGVIPAGVTLSICDHTVANAVTRCTGNIYVGNISATAGSADQPAAVTNKHNLFGHIRFDTGTVVFENVGRFAFHGCRFENGLTLTDSQDGSSNAVVVPGAGVARYWPAAIWTRLGYSESSTANVWGGCGFLVATAFAATRLRGTISGLVTLAGTTFQVASDCALTFAGLSHASVQPVAISLDSYCSFTYARLASQITSRSASRVFSTDYVTFAAPAAAADDTVANAPIDVAGGMFDTESYADVFIGLGAATRMEGRNSQGGGAAGGGRLAFRAVGGGARIIALGGSDGNFYADGGYAAFSDGAIGYMTGDRTFPAKVATDATPDLVVQTGALLRSLGDWAHTNVDTTPATLVRVLYGSKWIHGDPGLNGGGTGIYTIGDGAGGGIDCGAGAAIEVDSASFVQIGKPRVNNSNGPGPGTSRAIATARLSASRVGSGNGVNDAYLLSGSGGNTVTYGDAGVVAPNPVVAAFASDVAGAGNPQACTYEVI